MNRTISISTDVFAAIWALRSDDEHSEDEILRRVFNCKRDKEPNVAIIENFFTGVYDQRNNIKFREGFKIFRNYKGKKYSAIACNGNWFREDNHQSYQTLNKLNQSIVDGNENAWNGNWKFLDGHDKIKSINKLRNSQNSAA